MRGLFPTFVAAAIVAAIPGAFAQQESSPAGDYRGRGDTVQLERFDLAPAVEENVRQRMGPEQRTLELVQTTLLNRFGSLGFAELLDMNKVGETYVARVKTVRGETVNVEIDPMTGEIIGMETVQAATAPQPAPQPMAGAARAPSQQLAEPDEYAAVGTCEPAAWAGLSDRIDQLPRNQQLEANRLMRQIWEHYNDGESIACRQKIAELQGMVETAQ